MKMIYTIDDFQRIIHDGIDYKLQEATTILITKLNADIEKYVATLPEPEIQPRHVVTGNSAPYNSFSSTNRYKKTGFTKRQGGSRSSDLVHDSTPAEPFKPTQIVKKEGVEKIMTEIKGSLNKISNKNYENQKAAILERIVAMETDEDIRKIALAIIDIAGNNKFYSDIYADLFKELMASSDITRPCFTKELAEFLANYLASVRDIRFADSNTDYDKFCQCTKVNDRRKAHSVFILNLTKRSILEKSQMFAIIADLQDRVREYMEQEGRASEVEEITENIYLFVMMSLSQGSKSPDLAEWSAVLDGIRGIAKMKSKDKPSISSRAIFKYMDILDSLK
jgi:hypothetical protein